VCAKLGPLELWSAKLKYCRFHQSGVLWGLPNYWQQIFGAFFLFRGGGAASNTAAATAAILMLLGEFERASLNANRIRDASDCEMEMISPPV
jgi:hypothetical protein